MAAWAVSSLNTLSTPFSPASQGVQRAKACASGKSPFLRSPPCPLWRPTTAGCGCRCITTRAIAVGGDGKEKSQDQLQRASKQLPRRRSSQAAPMGLWERFPTARTVQQMIETMERLMEDPLAYSGVSLPSLDGDDGGGVGYRRGRTPWEIKEAEGEYRMRFDMPGMTRKDVKVWVEDNMLVVRAEKLPGGGKNNAGDGGEEGGGEEEEREWSARSYGRYNSRIALPDNVTVEKIRAEVKDGVLYIAIPKASTSGKVVDIDVQ